jgi:hypothetical protein
MSRRLAGGAALALLAALATGCADYGYGGAGLAPGYYDYYEPYGTYYGGWMPGYEVGPYHDGHHRPGEGRGGPPPGGGHHAFRPPPAGRTVPTIPSGARGGGHFGGGGGGGRR